MQKGVIVTCPEHDDATSYLTYFSQEIVNQAEEKQIKNIKVKDKNLNLSDFSKILKKFDYKLLVLNGHGSSDLVYGYKEEIIVKLNENDDLIKERLVYARSCNAGLKLGPEAMKQTKNGCFIGYSLPFIFYMDSRWTTKPHNDKVAKLFIEPSNLVPSSLIKGHTSLEAHNNSKRQMLKNMKKLIQGNQEQETPFYVEALWNNFLGQVIVGNEKAKL